MRRVGKLLMTGCFLSALLLSPLWAQTPPKGTPKALSPVIQDASQAAPVLSPVDVAVQETLPLPQPVETRPAPDAVTMKITVSYSPEARRVFKKIYNPPRVNEKEQIRAAWKRAFGCDVWLPYYVAKDIEDKVSEKMSVRVFKMKGKPKLEKDGFVYVFKRTF